MSQPVRRVVTGHDAEGKAVFVSDSLVEPVVTALSPATAFHQIWGGDGPPSFPDDGTRPPTPTIDFEVVLTGEVVLELDDGAAVRLRPGDTVVQNGTRHRWSNPGDVPATLAVFICGAHHAGVGVPNSY